jgi:hypothetical protein
MRAWTLRLGCLLLAGAGLLGALSLSRGQETTPPKGPISTSNLPPGTYTPDLNIPIKGALAPAEATAASESALFRQQIRAAAEQSAGWLQRVNRVDGRFQHGQVPALARPLDGDHYLRQAGAAFALARAARCFKNDRAAAIARQAVLTLLIDTEKDPQNPQARRTVFPSPAVNRLGAAGLLLLAIHELPAPGDDLLAQSEELCNYVRLHQRPDGSLSSADPADAGKDQTTEQEGTDHYPGLALYGLARSQQQRPTAWKLDVLRRARACYQAQWRAGKQTGIIPWQTAACTEAYLLTREQPFADFVNEMNDWLCGLQYEQLTPQQVLWQGGFMTWVDGRPTATPPDIAAAAYAESLAEACRVARQTGDVQRDRRYRQALERALGFLATLQYTEANAQHFAAWYRPEIVGAFHASQQDGTVRIDYVQHGLCALVQYLTCVAE